MPMVVETNEEYHASEPTSKSKLWKLWSKTPYHARFGRPKAMTSQQQIALEVGKAVHIAILEPDLLDQSVTCGPVDRRGNKWKEAQDFAAAAGTILLTASDFEMVLLIRDAAAVVPEIALLQDDAGHLAETSAYTVDPRTGLAVKCRPDIYSPQHRLIGDVKTAADASYFAFKRDAAKFGYHMQHPLYSEVWEAGTELPVDGFFFIVLEKSDPPAVACYELTPSAIAEGHATYCAALDLYKECLEKDEWPGYPSGIQKVGLNYRDYKLTPPPTGEEADAETQIEEDDIPDMDDAELEPQT